MHLNSLDRVLIPYLDEYYGNKTPSKETDIWQFIYRYSVIVLDELWEQYTLLSIKTNNDIETLERMDMWKFKALSKKVEKYIELENNQNGGSEDPNNGMNSQNSGMNNVNQMMNSSKNMMKNSSANFKAFK